MEIFPVQVLPGIGVVIIDINDGRELGLQQPFKPVDRRRIVLYVSVLAKVAAVVQRLVTKEDGRYTIAVLPFIPTLFFHIKLFTTFEVKGMILTSFALVRAGVFLFPQITYAFYCIINSWIDIINFAIEHYGNDGIHHYFIALCIHSRFCFRIDYQVLQVTRIVTELLLNPELQGSQRLIYIGADALYKLEIFHAVLY